MRPVEAWHWAVVKQLLWTDDSGPCYCCPPSGHQNVFGCYTDFKAPWGKFVLPDLKTPQSEWTSRRKYSAMQHTEQLFPHHPACGQFIIIIITPCAVAQPSDRGPRLHGRRGWVGCSGQRDLRVGPLGSHGRSVVLLSRCTAGRESDCKLHHLASDVKAGSGAKVSLDCGVHLMGNHWDTADYHQAR